jgi:hypothetical protein
MSALLGKADGGFFMVTRRNFLIRASVKADGEVVQGITWDTAKRMKSPRLNDQTPEGRTLARVGKVLKFKQE